MLNKYGLNVSSVGLFYHVIFNVQLYVYTMGFVLFFHVVAEDIFYSITITLGIMIPRVATKDALLMNVVHDTSKARMRWTIGQPQG